ncbi:DUF1272 domain-containing protein [Maribacter aestuarii]|uniref:DUF1272 domain-containing protein n=1 Tax=Maribacter aestuarii TaxID=1130723 RepID=UPI00248CD8FA|nr:DUF1272 domain-containing protein [Maribacter aestuarii]
MEIRLNCENCDIPLLNNSKEAMICTFDCTFCKDCVDTILKNVCPNCGGGFEKRPTRPKELLYKYPPSDKKILKPVNMEKFQQTLNKFKKIMPSDR